MFEHHRHHHQHRRVNAQWPHYNCRDSKSYGGPASAVTNFGVPIGSHPPQVDLRTTGRLPPVYDQGQLGSCTANALAAAVHFNRPDLAPSRLFIYYNERTIEGDVQDDSGACLKDGCKSIQNTGVCSEATWPYSDDKQRFLQRPPDHCYSEAAANRSAGFANVLPDHDHLKAALASGMPVAFAIKIYTSFEGAEVAQSGRVPLPDTSSEQCLGGHAVLMVGYDEYQQVWIVRNSWGASWGDQGYCYLPYRYICDDHLATDCWIVQGQQQQQQQYGGYPGGDQQYSGGQYGGGQYGGDQYGGDQYGGGQYGGDQYGGGQYGGGQQW